MSSRKIMAASFCRPWVWHSLDVRNTKRSNHETSPAGTMVAHISDCNEQLLRSLENQAQDPLHILWVLACIKKTRWRDPQPTIKCATNKLVEKTGIHTKACDHSTNIRYTATCDFNQGYRLRRWTQLYSHGAIQSFHGQRQANVTWQGHRETYPWKTQTWL